MDLGLELGDHAAALVYPQVSSYVGGDIVAGVMGSGMYRTEKLTLFMDIGTNAEIVVGNKDWMACAACSAGPALEGGNIEFGMRAAKGAIEDFSLDPATLEPMILTIGNVRPKGICGSGLITTVAVMFEMGVINNLGKFDRDLDTPRIRPQENVYEYVLAWADETQVERDIVLTEIDIENLIRAKGAIYSGCMTLLEEVGLGITDLSGGRFRQLCGSRKGHDHRPAARDRSAEGDLYRQRLPPGRADGRPHQPPAPGRGHGDPYDDQF